jgi:hypothetical protein
MAETKVISGTFGEVSRSTDSTGNKTNTNRQSYHGKQTMSKIFDRYGKKDSTEIRKETKPAKP